MRRRVMLHILWDGGFGGAEKFMRDFVRYSDKTKFDHVIVFLSEGGWFSNQMEKDGVKIHLLGMKNGFSLIKGMRLVNIINGTRPDIIHNHFRNYLSNIIISFFKNIHKIYIEHGGDWLWKNPWKQIIFYKCFSRIYDLLLVNSEAVKDRILKLTNESTERIKTLYLGIDVKEYTDDSFDKEKVKKELGLPLNSRVIGVVARLVEFKGIDDFIRVAAEIDGIKKGYSYVIVGDGCQRSILEKMALNLKVKCHFLGGRSDVKELLKVFDLFLITSKWEAFGIAVLEAMASRVPVLGFSTSGIKEIMPDDSCGFLMADRNYKKLAAAAIDTLNDVKRYNKLSEGGYRRALEYFDVKKTVRLLEDFYDLIIEDRV